MIVSEIFLKIHSREDWDKLRSAYYYPPPVNEIRFPARQWYYDCDNAISSLPTEPEFTQKRRKSSKMPFYAPVSVIGWSITAFYVMCLSFVIAMCCKIVDAVDSGLAIACIILLAIGIIVPLVVGSLNKSLYDLN